MSDTLRARTDLASVPTVTESPDQGPDQVDDHVELSADGLGGTDSAVDLTQIERDLEGVETALRRLDDGSYWTDEVSGEPIPDDVLAADPVARRTS